MQHSEFYSIVITEFSLFGAQNCCQLDLGGKQWVFFVYSQLLVLGNSRRKTTLKYLCSEKCQTTAATTRNGGMQTGKMQRNNHFTYFPVESLAVRRWLSTFKRDNIHTHSCCWVKLPGRGKYKTSNHKWGKCQVVSINHPSVSNHNHWYVFLNFFCLNCLSGIQQAYLSAYHIICIIHFL